VSNIHYAIPTSEPDDVRWEKVDHIRLMLANGTYHVSLEQVAAKVIDQMLESGRSSRMTNSDSHVGGAYDCEGSQNKLYEGGRARASAANRHET
jgi:hypothetical protein